MFIREINIITSLHKFRKGGTPMLIDNNANKNRLIRGIPNKPRFEDSRRVWEFEYKRYAIANIIGEQTPCAITIINAQE